MSGRLLLCLFFLFTLMSCQSDNEGKISSATATTPPDLSFDSPPVVSNIFPASMMEDIESAWIYLPYTDAENHEALSCNIFSRSYVNVTAPCICSFGMCRVRVKGFSDYNGTASFRFSVTANNQTSNAGLALFSILPVSEAPIAPDASFSTPEEVTYISNGLGRPHLQGIDADGDTLTCTKLSDTTHGTITLNSDCSFTYVPTPNYEGPDLFTYNVSDGFYISNTASVEITVTHVNDPPITNDFAFVTHQNVSSQFTMNVSDLDVGDPFLFIIVTPPAHGSITGTGATRAYTPSANYIGSDSFTYMVFDGTVNSNVSTVSISILTPTIYLSSAGDDGTAAVNDPALPFLTAQAAVNAAIAFAPTTQTPLIIDVGAGSFGDVTLTQDFGLNISWRGVNAASSIIGNILNIGADGVDGTASGDPSLGDYNGTDATDGHYVYILSDYNIQFGNINTSGGDGGLHAPDTVTYFAHPGLAGDAGGIYVTGKFGALIARGGSGYAGGSGGEILLDVNSTSIDINASGGLDSCTVVSSCHTDVDGRDGGEVQINTNAVVTGTITSRGGESNGHEDFILGFAGEGGFVHVYGTVTGDINTTGGNSYDSVVGIGGAVGIEASGIVNGDIFASAGDSSHYGGGVAGGEVHVYGVAQNIYTTSNNLPCNGVSGGYVLIAAGGSANSISAGGSEGLCSSGTAAMVEVAGTVSGSINVDGADSNDDHATSMGGIVNVGATGVVGIISAQGGNNLNAGESTDGGQGGAVTLLNGATYTLGQINVSGGSGNVLGNNGVDGTITVVP